MNTIINYRSMKKFFLILAIIFCTMNAFAARQHVGRIKGSIKEAKSAEPVGFATVALMKLDSTLVTGVSADMDGNYEISAADGYYILKVSMIGYHDYCTQIQTTPGETIVPTIILEEDTQLLQGAVVSERVQLVEMKIDKMVVNISSSAFAQTSNGYDLLKKSPGVTIDKDGNVSLNGKSVSVWIDGRPTYLDGESLQALLKGTSGSSIDKIELISNPSSKYDAEGKGGIINIKTIRNTLSGLYGNVGANGGGMYFNKQNMWSTQESVWGTISYRTDKTNTTLNLSQGIQNMPLILNIHTEGKTIADIRQETYSLMNAWARSYNATISHDFFIDKKNVIGVIASVPYTISGSPVEEKNNTTEDYRDGVLYQTSTGQIESESKNRQYSANINYTHIFDERKGSEITTNIDWYRMGNGSINYQTNKYVPKDGRDPFIMERNIDNLSCINIWSAKTDYQTLFWQNGMLETGAKWAMSVTDNDMMRTETGLPEANNNFKYREHVAAAYISASKQFGPRLSAKLGLRGEYTNVYGDWRIDGTVTDLSYFDIFPTAFVGYVASEKLYLSLAYTRRINRPNFYRLNPAEMYISSSTYAIGNPRLKPEYSDNITLTTAFGRHVSLSLAYSYTSGLFYQRPSVKDNGEQYIMWDNFGKEYNPSATLSVSALPITKWLEWTFVMSGRYVRNVSDEKNFTRTLPTAFAYTAFTFLLPSNWKLELDGYAMSKQLWGSYDIAPLYQSNFAVKKTLLDNKLSLSLTVNDLFRSTRTDLITNASVQDYSTICQEYLMQRVIFGVNWSFGKGQRGKSRKVGQVDEVSRASAGAMLSK